MMKKKLRLVAVAVIENYDGKILIGKKDSNSLKSLAGKWHLIGGDVKFQQKESSESAVIREVREETGLVVKILDSLDISTRQKTNVNPPEHILTFWYRCSLFDISKSPKADGDLEEIKWVEKEDVLSSIDPLARERVPDGVRKFLAEK